MTNAHWSQSLAAKWTALKFTTHHQQYARESEHAIRDFCQIIKIIGKSGAFSAIHYGTQPLPEKDSEEIVYGTFSWPFG